MKNKVLELLKPYNSWWATGKVDPNKLQKFRRPLHDVLSADIERIPQMLSVTGPRRVGKSTLLYQLISGLLEKGIPPHRITYYSLDDPALDRKGITGGDLLENYFRGLPRGPGDSQYVFLDEVQRLDRWELYLKKYYDLKYPIRFVISGSASSPIFKKSRESLLGRVRDHHLLPFSFREFLLFRWGDQPTMVNEMARLHEMGRTIHGMLTGDPHLTQSRVDIRLPPPHLQAPVSLTLNEYFLEGGFPEVWALGDWVAKQDYLFENQVKKVIYEDLVLAAEFRKPELLKRFYISLLEAPGREVSIQAAAGETGITALQIEKYLPLLEMTDLVYPLTKFRKSPLRVRKGKMKFYLVDLTLRNAVLRLTETLLKDDTILGLYAENLVYLALRKWRGAIEMDYYRERDAEVDFIVHIGPRRYLPVEVKYRNTIGAEDLRGIGRFVRRFKVQTPPIVVTKNWEHFGWKDGILQLPLPAFLLMFD